MPTESIETKSPGRPLGYAAPDSQGEVYRLGAASLALALVGQPTGMVCSMSLTGRGLAWGDTAGFFIFCAVMVAAACLGLRARERARQSDVRLRAGWLGAAAVWISMLLLALFGAGFLITRAA